MSIPLQRRPLHDAVLQAFVRCFGQRSGVLEPRHDNHWHGAWQTTAAGFVLAGPVANEQDRYAFLVLIANWRPLSASLTLELALIDSEGDYLRHVCGIEQSLVSVIASNEDTIIFRTRHGWLVIHDYTFFSFSRKVTFDRFRAELGL